MYARKKEEVSASLPFFIASENQEFPFSTMLSVIYPLPPPARLFFFIPVPWKTARGEVRFGGHGAGGRRATRVPGRALWPGATPFFSFYWIFVVFFA